MKTLRPYQLDCVSFIKNKKTVGLFLEMGLGKTLITLHALSQLLEEGEIRRVLVITTLRIANNVWYQELDSSGLNIVMKIATGLKKNKINTFNSDHDILVTNKESISLLDENKFYMNYDCLVIDESTIFKSSSTKRFKILRRIAKYFNYRIILSGTPCPEKVTDLWSQIYILDRGERLGRTKTQFNADYCTSYVISSKFNFVITKLKDGMESVIMEKIKDIILIKKTRDYLNINEPIYINKYYYLNKKTKELYDSVYKDSFYVKEGWYKEVIKPFVGIEEVAKVTKLLQIINSGFYNEDKKYVHIHNEKVMLLVDLLKEIDGNVLIAYNYRSDIPLIKKYIPDAVEFEDNLLEKWNDNKIKVMLIHPNSAGHGLNFQYGSSTLIWYGLIYSLEKYLQTNARIIRSGQRNNPKIIHLISRNKAPEDELIDEGGSYNLDMKVLNKLRRKQTDQDFFLSLYKIC